MLICFILTASFLVNGNTISCYVCTSADDSGCNIDSYTGQNSDLQQCDAGVTTCLIISTDLQIGRNGIFKIELLKVVLKHRLPLAKSSLSV